MKSPAVKKEFLISILVSTIVIMGALLISGAFFTGYHFVDDHEFINIQRGIQNEGIWMTLISWVKSSFSIRFRPIYIICRVLGVWLFGLHWQIWYLVKAIEMIISMTLLYWFARKMKAAIGTAVMFSCMIMCGTQAEIWCRLGPQESLGLPLLSILFIIGTKPYSTRRNIILTALLLILGGVKESFILIMPAVVFFVIWYELWMEDSKFTVDEICKVIWKNRGFTIISILFFLFYLLIIVFYVGVHPIDYAGFPEGMSWKQYIWTFLRLFKEDDQIGYYYGWLIITTILTVIGADHKRIQRNLRKYIYAVLLLGFSIIGQVVLYITAGMRSRYLIPWIIGICCYTFLLCKNILRRNLLIKILFNTVCLGMCILVIVWTKKPLSKFVETGDSAEFIIRTLEENYSDGDKVFIGLEDIESKGSLAQYLYSVSKIENVYYRNNESLINAINPFVQEANEINAADASFIILDNDEEIEKDFFKESNLDMTQYKKDSLLRYTIYEKISAPMP